MMKVPLSSLQFEGLVCNIIRAVYTSQARCLPVNLPDRVLSTALYALVKERPRLIRGKIAKMFKDLAPEILILPAEYEALMNIASTACGMCLYELKIDQIDPLMMSMNREIQAIVQSMERQVGA